MFDFFKKIPFWMYVYVSWIASLVGTLASLAYSDILNIPICPLCWYQRIAMYPLILLYPVGIMLKDKKVFYYTLPLITLGLLISIYQVLLQAGFIPYTLVFCDSGAVSCAEINFKLFGLFTIPFQAFAGFGFLFVAGVFGAGSLSPDK